MPIQAHDYEALIADIWVTLLGFEFEPTVPENFEWLSEAISSQVQIRAKRNWTVHVACEPTLAKEVAEAMFKQGTDGSSRDVRDALGEIANIVAGNTKGALADTLADVSLPRADTLRPTHSSADELQVTLRHLGHHIQFRILQSASSGAQETPIESKP